MLKHTMVMGNHREWRTRDGLLVVGAVRLYLLKAVSVFPKNWGDT